MAPSPGFRPQDGQGFRPDERLALGEARFSDFVAPIGPSQSLAMAFSAADEGLARRHHEAARKATAAIEVTIPTTHTTTPTNGHPESIPHSLMPFCSAAQFLTILSYCRPCRLGGAGMGRVFAAAALGRTGSASEPVVSAT
jgi:hypothetical protein